MGTYLVNGLTSVRLRSVHIVIGKARRLQATDIYVQACRYILSPTTRQHKYTASGMRGNNNIFSKLCRYVHHVMGVCCIVFDIDGMFEFFMNFLNIEKNKIF